MINWTKCFRRFRRYFYIFLLQVWTKYSVLVGNLSTWTCW